MKTQNNNCQRKEDLITYLYGELSGIEETNFKQHLDNCLSCKKEVSEFGMLRENLQTWQAPETPRIVLDLPLERPRSLREILQELGSVLPAWFKYGTGFATASAAALLLLAIFNTQIRYDQNGFSFNVALFNNNPVSTKTVNVVNESNEETTKAMIAKALSDKEAQINQALDEKRAQIEVQLRKQIDFLSSELSEKSSSQLSKASLELKRQHRAELERALQQIQRQGSTAIDDDDPFNLWGGVNDKVIEKAFENDQAFVRSGQ